jgi:hypothetical protein
LSIYRRGAPYVAPQNAAVAVNAGCLRCLTVAVAVQYLIPVDDPTAIPPDVRRLGHELESALRDLMRERATSVRDRVPRLISIVEQFAQFRDYVEVRVREVSEANAMSGDAMAAELPAETDDPGASAPVPSPSTSPLDSAPSEPIGSSPGADPGGAPPTATPLDGSPDPTVPVDDGASPPTDDPAASDAPIPPPAEPPTPQPTPPLAESPDASPVPSSEGSPAPSPAEPSSPSPSAAP